MHFQRIKLHALTCCSVVIRDPLHGQDLGSSTM